MGSFFKVMYNRTYIKGNINMSYFNQPKIRRTFIPEFKAQLVTLYYDRKRKCDIIREYEILGLLLE